jgi:hypothetical protein
MGKNLSSCIPFDFYPHLTTNAGFANYNACLQSLLNPPTTPGHENNCYRSPDGELCSV